MAPTPFFERFETKVFVLAVVVRLFFVMLFPGVNYYGGITGEYLDVVNNLLNGHGLTQYVDIAPYDSGTADWQYMPFVARPIGYILFLLLAGGDPVIAQILQAFLTAASVVLVYKLSRVLFDDGKRDAAGFRITNREEIARAAAVLAAVWPNQARFEVALLPDGPTTLIMLAVAYKLTLLAISNDQRHLWHTAIVLALSIFVRPDFVLFPTFFFVAAWLLWNARTAVVRTAPVLLLLAATIGLNTWKNYAISGEMVPLNLGSGTTMYEGISQFGDTLGTTYADERVAHEKLNSKYLFYPNGPENDRMLFRQAVEIIKEYPGFYATLLVKRIPLMFTVRGLYFDDSISYLDPNDDLANRFPDKYFAMAKERPVELAVRILSPLLGWVLVILGFWGIVHAMRRNWRMHTMIVALLLYWILSHLPTNVEPRYFYPAVPLLYGYAVYLITEFMSKRSVRQAALHSPAST